MTMGQPDMRFLQGETYAPVGAPKARGGVTRGLKLDVGEQWRKGLKSGRYQVDVRAGTLFGAIPVGPGGIRALLKPAVKIAATMLAAEILTPDIDIFRPMLGNGRTAVPGIPTSPAGIPTSPGGGTVVTMQNVMPYGIAGPGVPEPADGTWSKRWNIVTHSNAAGTYRVYFWQMVDGYTICYNPATKGWKRWKARKNIVLSSNPRIGDLARAERAVYGKLKRMAKRSPFLKISSKSSPHTSK